MQISCTKCRNVLGSARSPGRRTTHKIDLERSQTSRAAKLPYQAVSTTSRNALGMSETSTSTERTHQVDIETEEGTWRCRESRESSRSIGTAGTFFRAPDTMEDIPGASGTSAALIRTRYVESEGREATWSRKSDRETSMTIGSARATATATRWMGYHTGWTTQRVVRAASQNDSIQDRHLGKCASSNEACAVVKRTLFRERIKRYCS